MNLSVIASVLFGLVVATYAATAAHSLLSEVSSVLTVATHTKG